MFGSVFGVSEILRGSIFIALINPYVLEDLEVSFEKPWHSLVCIGLTSCRLKESDLLRLAIYRLESC